MELNGHQWDKIMDLVEDVAKETVKVTTTATPEKSKPKIREEDERIKVITKLDGSDLFICCRVWKQIQEEIRMERAHCQEAQDLV